MIKPSYKGHIDDYYFRSVVFHLKKFVYQRMLFNQCNDNSVSEISERSK